MSVFKKALVAAFLFISYLLFTAWVYTEGTATKSALGTMNESAYQGKLAYQELNCCSCHQIFGLGGYLGPDLTHVMSQPGKGPLYVRAFLSIATKQMPDFHLDSLQAGQIIDYLSYVDSSATLERNEIALMINN